MATQTTKLAYSPAEAATLMGISRNLVYELLGSGKLHSVKAGGRRLIPASAISAFLAGVAEAA